MAKPSTRSTQTTRPAANEISGSIPKGRSATATNQKHNPSRKPPSKAWTHHQPAGDTSSAQYRTRKRVATEHAEISHEHALKTNQKGALTRETSPFLVIGVDSKIQSNILMVLLDSFWNTILSTNLDARTRTEGPGYELTALELKNWESISAMRPMGSSDLFITATTPGQENYDSKVLLKSNLASLYVTLLTTPSKLTSKPIEAFICESIVSEQFVNDTRSGQAFVEFISEYEIQKYCLARLETLEEETPSLFDTDQAPQLTLWDYVRYLRPKECLQPAIEHPLSPAFQMCCRVSYEELIPVRSSTQDLESQNPYSGLIDSIIHLLRSEFPEFKISEPNWTLRQSDGNRPSSIARSSSAFAAQHTSRPTNLLRAKSHVPEEQTDERRENRLAVSGLRGGDDEDEDLSDSNSRSASQSFLIDALIPQDSNSQMDDLAESYDGPYAGSPEARHHENVANEIEVNANLCRVLSRELSKSPNKFSARFSHPVSGPARLDGELDKVGGSKERKSLPNKQPQRNRFEFSRPQPDASQLSWSETQMPTPGNNRKSAPVADRSDSTDFGPARGDVESESRGVSSASSDLQQRKRRLPSSDIHMELGLHQDHPIQSEESPSRLGEQPSSGSGEAESGAQQQQHSGSNNHTAIGRNPIESEESSQQLGERSRSGSGQGESEEGSSATSRAEQQHQCSNIRHDPTKCKKRAGEQSGSQSAEGQVRGRSSASSDVQVQQHSSLDNRMDGVPELVNSTKFGESLRVPGSGLSAQQPPDTPWAQHIGFNDQADQDEPGAGAQERPRLGETVGAGGPSPDQFVDDHRQQEAGESNRKSSGRREGLKERKNDECVEEGEEEGTQTIRGKKQRASEKPGSASRQLESPVDLHSRTFKGRSKASTFKQKKQAGERPGRSKQTHIPPLRGRQAQTFETDSDDTSDDDEQVKDKAGMSTEAKTKMDKTLDGKLEEVDSKAPAQGSGTVMARSKRSRKVRDIGRAGSNADTSDDEQQGQGQGRKGLERKKRRRKAKQGSRESSPTERASPSKGASSKVPTEKKTQRRQFWTDEQEELLINEVVRFHDKYNCMAYILKRHGPGGYKSQVLANRTNVMLKDKAVQISTKWARQGTHLDEKTRSAFSRFPPKFGVIRGSSVEMGAKVEEVEEEYEIEDVEVEGDWTRGSKRARTEVGGGPQASGSDAALPSEPVGPARAGEALEGPPSPDKTPKSRTSLSPRVVSERRSAVHPRASTPLGEGKNGSQEIPIAPTPGRGGQISQGDFPVLSSPR